MTAFPNIRARDCTVLPNCVPVYSLAAPVVYSGETVEDMAAWFEVSVAEVAEAVRYLRCWLTRRTPYERSFAK